MSQLSSAEEFLLIALEQDHWIPLVEGPTGIPVPKMWDTVALEIFRSGRSGPEVEALRKVCNALAHCKVYRHTSEFAKLCSFGEIIADEDFLRLAFDADDAVSLCESVSRRYGFELTLKQAGDLMERAGDLCEGCFLELNDEGYCDPCEEPK